MSMGAWPRQSSRRLCLLPSVAGFALVAAICLGVSPGPPVAPAAASRTPQRSIYLDLIERASAYVAAFEKKFSAVVAEEHYVQEVKASKAPPGAGPRPTGTGMKDGAGIPTRPPAPSPSDVSDYRSFEPRTRRMISDVLMVQLPDRTWYGFRDVIDVDGHRVRNREDRLRELFLESQTTSQRIVDESARYNIGPIQRNLNLPTFALAFLHPDFRGRFVLDFEGEEPLGERATVVYRFKEQARPTIVRTDRKEDVPAAGRFWVDRKTAEVVQTELVLDDVKHRFRAQIVVSYAPNAELGQLVPAEMRESYIYPTQPLYPTIDCVANYSKFRRFTVQVDEKIQIPKEIK